MTITTSINEMDGLISRMGTITISSTLLATPFRFFDLPFELRLLIYSHLLVLPKTVDLDPSNARSLAPLLRLFLVSQRMHDEASGVFYAHNTFRIFPIHGRFFHTKEPLLARLPPRYRSLITKLELRLGPGWTKPPKGWIVDGRLRLEEAENVRLLKVFVECDPASHPIFEGFRNGDDFYTQFSVALVRSLFAQLRGLAEVQFDAYPSVSRASPLLQSLIVEAKGQNKRISWGPEGGWDKILEVDLANVLQPHQRALAEEATLSQAVPSDGRRQDPSASFESFPWLGTQDGGQPSAL